MKKVFSKENVKKFWKENKEFVIGVGVAIGGIAATMAYINNADKELEEERQEILDGFKETEETFEEFDYGRDCLMTFTVKESGETIGTAECSELYATEFMDGYNSLD